MLFWIFTIIFAIFIALIIYDFITLRFSDGLFGGCIIMAVLSCVTVVIMLLIIVSSHAATDATIAEKEATYDSLVYQYENDIYDNDNDLGKKELMNDIQEWNTNLAFDKEIQDNFWLGIFYPNIYDQFEFIELE